MRRSIGRWVLAASVPLLLLSGCRGVPWFGSMSAPAPAPAAPIVAPIAASVTADPNRRLAVSHQFALQLPNDAVAETQKKHLDACVAAGCLVLSTNLSENGYGGPVFGSISIRIAPDRFPVFAALLAAPPATLTAHSEKAEDETLAVLDVEKRLEAQEALRDRLTAMLKQQGDTVADLVAIEKTLAEVQETIETATARRDHLRTIADTVLVDVGYRGMMPDGPAPSAFEPLTFALDGFGRTIVGSVAQLVSFVAAVLPWLPLLALVFWLTRRLWRGRRGKVRAVAAAESATPPPAA